MAVATDERRVLREASGRASSTHLELQVIPVVRKSSLTLAAVKSDAVPICRLAEVAQSGQETHVDGCADVTRQYEGASGRLCSPCIGTTAPYARGRVVRPLLQSSFFYWLLRHYSSTAGKGLTHRRGVIELYQLYQVLYYNIFIQASLCPHARGGGPASRRRRG